MRPGEAVITDPETGEAAAYEDCPVHDHRTIECLLSSAEIAARTFL